MKRAEHAGSWSARGVADLSLQQGDLLREQLDHVLLSKCSGKQEAERGACGGEQAGQNQTLPWPEYGSSQHVLQDKHRWANVLNGAPLL